MKDRANIVLTGSTAKFFSTLADGWRDDEVKAFTLTGEIESIVDVDDTTTITITSPGIKVSWPDDES